MRRAELGVERPVVVDLAGARVVRLRGAGEAPLRRIEIAFAATADDRLERVAEGDLSEQALVRSPCHPCHRCRGASGLHATSTPSNATSSNSLVVVRAARRRSAVRADEFVAFGNGHEPAPLGKSTRRSLHRDRRTGSRQARCDDYCDVRPWPLKSRIKRVQDRRMYEKAAERSDPENADVSARCGGRAPSCKPCGPPTASRRRQGYARESANASGPLAERVASLRIREQLVQRVREGDLITGGHDDRDVVGHDACETARSRGDHRFAHRHRFDERRDPCRKRGLDHRNHDDGGAVVEIAQRRRFERSANHVRRPCAGSFRLAFGENRLPSAMVSRAVVGQCGEQRLVVAVLAPDRHHEVGLLWRAGPRPERGVDPVRHELETSRPGRTARDATVATGSGSGPRSDRFARAGRNVRNTRRLAGVSR